MTTLTDGPGAELSERSPATLPLSLPGIDVTQGLRYSNGKLPLFFKVTQIFLNTHGKNFAGAVESAIAAEDWTTAARLAHTLKSSARTVGAARLGNLTETLELAFRDPYSLNPSHFVASLLTELDTVCSSLSELNAEWAGQT